VPAGCTATTSHALARTNRPAITFCAAATLVVAVAADGVLCVAADGVLTRSAATHSSSRRLTGVRFDTRSWKFATCTTSDRENHPKHRSDALTANVVKVVLDLAFLAAFLDHLGVVSAQRRAVVTDSLLHSRAQRQHATATRAYSSPSLHLAHTLSPMLNCTSCTAADINQRGARARAGRPSKFA
jgi:hypothetical protein